ncbi:MAG: hypothetical protein JWR38_2276 [Mucilaginibacter sp.]|nr:hypothetical protein [Mucilaginibacter sp.]
MRELNNHHAIIINSKNQCNCKYFNYYQMKKQGKIVFLIIILNTIVIANVMAANNMKDSTKLISQERTLKAFNSITSGAPVDFNISQGNTGSVTIKVPDAGMLNYIKTELRDGVLSVYVVKNNKFNWENSGSFTGGTSGGRPNKITIFITVKQLSSIHLSGSAIVYFIQDISASGLSLDISGSAGVKGAIKVHQLFGKLSGSADVAITGQVDNMDMNLEGSATINAAHLLTSNARVNMQGSSIAKVKVSTQLIAQAAGNSSLSYVGKATHQAFNTSGNATIKQMVNDK